MPYDRFNPLKDGVLREDGYIAKPYVIDAHAHIHLHIPKSGEKRFNNFFEVSKRLSVKDETSFIDPESLIHEMDRYGIDKAVIHAADAMYIDYDKYCEILAAYPDRFIGFYWPQYDWKDRNGENVPLTPQQLADQTEKILSNPLIKGLGEGLIVRAAEFCERKSWPMEDILRYMMPMLEVVADKKVPMLMHSGPDPYKFMEGTPQEMRKYYRPTGGHALADPIVYDEIATMFPEIPLIIGHCGVQGSYFYGSFADHALMLAAMHDNVYLETSMAPAELIEKAIHDPGIGAEKLVMGSDFGATSSWYVHNGQVLPSYKKKPFPELPGCHIEQMVRSVQEVTMTPEERRLIMGQNMSRILKLD